MAPPYKDVPKYAGILATRSVLELAGLLIYNTQCDLGVSILCDRDLDKLVLAI